MASKRKAESELNKETESDNVAESKNINECGNEESEVEKLNKALEEMTAFAQRAKADMENIKKRNQNIASDMYLEGKRDTVLKILPIVDNFDRALEIEMDENVKTGFENIRRMFTEIFEKMDIKEIECKGAAFDPDYHNALMQVDDEENSGKVVNVFEKGYMLGDKVLRHASVVVAK